MNTYQLDLQEGGTAYIKTEANKMQLQSAIDFVKMGAEPTIEKLLNALRTLGFKAQQIKIDTTEVFDF